MDGGTQPAIAPCGEVLAAIAKAMGAVKRIARDGKNTHDGYGFASIDSFLAAVNPICAEAGIIIHMDEVATEDFTRKSKFGESPWMRVRFSIAVMHVSGQGLPPVTRSVEVLRNGAQAYGSAQSYALKQFLRALLLIPTGDKDDADFRASDDGEIIHAKAAAKKDPKWAAPANAEAAQIACDSIAAADTLDALAAIWRDLPAGVKSLPAVTAAKDARKAALTPKPADDLGGDEIPY
jgi:hypothetical protein